MLTNVFAKAVRDQRWALLWWSVGLAALVALTIASYPSMRDAAELNETLQDLPEAVKALVGGETDFTSPPGFLNSQFFAFVGPLIFLIYAVAMGSSAIGGEEETGTLDLLLSLPVPRWRVVLQKFLAMGLILVVYGLVLWLSLWIGARLVDMAISAGNLAAATAGTTLLGIFFAALALAVGAITGQRGLSTAIAAAVGLGGYLLNALAPLSDILDPLRPLSPFYYVTANDPLREGLSVGDSAVLVVATLILLAVALILFQRRDVAV